MDTIIWDFDGTLGYSAGGRWTVCLLAIASRHAPEHPVDPAVMQARLRSCFPWNSPDRPHPEITTADAWWEALQGGLEAPFRDAGFGPEEARAMALEVRSVYTHPDRWCLYDDTRPALARLSAAGWSHVLLTNHVPELREIIGRLGLESSFSRIYNSAETGYEKPHPAAFCFVLNDLRGSGRLWMVGDNVAADVLGAEAVGIPGILVRHYHEGAARFCRDLNEVTDLILMP